jgi:hypothetical protein
VALGVGIGAGGGGAYAVFASANQAGTAILLVLSAIFLLVGIQGTSLIRFSTGSNTVELERRGRGVAQRAEETAKKIAKQEPGRALGILEGARLALPALGPISEHTVTSLLAAEYEITLSAAISAMGYIVTGAELTAESHPDLLAEDPKGHEVVGVKAQYVHQAPPESRGPESGRLVGPPRTEGKLPLLIVTNSPVSARQSDWARTTERKAPMRMISWRDGSDNQILQDSLTELFSLIR